MMCPSCGFTSRDFYDTSGCPNCGSKSLPRPQPDAAKLLDEAFELNARRQRDLHPPSKSTAPPDFVLTRGPPIKQALRIAELWFETWSREKQIEWNALSGRGPSAPWSPTLAIERIRDLLREAGVG